MWAIYGQTLGFEFVNFDDDAHITENPHVVSGLSHDNLAWDFGIHGPSQWHPLAWLSHQTDCAVYGLNPAGHHATNVLLHTFAAMLLYLTLQRLISSWSVAAFTAAAFAVHPLNVESVAWVSERRNVLCAVFALLTVRAYVWFVSRPTLPRYAACLTAHAAALMAKPLAVTMPCVLLLLDDWPLSRLRRANVQAGADPGLAATSAGPDARSASALRLVVEKLPLLVLSFVSALLSIFCQQAVGTVASLKMIPLSVRLTNALAGYGWYVQKMFWPFDLAVFYPHPAILNENPWPQLVVPAIAGAVIIVLMTSVSLWQHGRRPWLFVGWFWYLGMMVPMIGIMQVGEQQEADRYAYLPMIGLFLALACAGESVAQRSRRAARGMRFVAGGLLCGWALTAGFQAAVWRNSAELFTRALEVNPRNHWAHNNLGHALLQQGKALEAAAHFRQAIQIAPTYALGHHNLGAALQEMGQKSAARAELEISLAYDPNSPQTRQRLGILLLEQGQAPAAIGHLREGVRLAPDDAQAHFNLGIALAKTGQIAEALAALRQARALKPDWQAVADAIRTIEASP